MARQTKLYQLADVLLSGELAKFLRDHRSQGDSWDTIAKKLWAATDHRVDVTGQTVQGWFDRLDESVPA